MGVGNAGVLGGLARPRSHNPLTAGGGVDGAFGGGGSLGSLVRNGFAGIGDLFDVPLSPPAQEKTSEISTVPSIVKTPFTPLEFVPGQPHFRNEHRRADRPSLTAVTKTLGNVRNEIRTNFNATNARPGNRHQRCPGSG